MAPLHQTHHLVRIRDACDPRNANVPGGDSQIEHGRASPGKAIEVALELVVEHHVACVNLVVPEVTGLLVHPSQHERRVRFGVEMTTQRSSADGLPPVAHRGSIARYPVQLPPLAPALLGCFPMAELWPK